MTDVSPWLGIPAEDYDGHMRQVGQADALRNIFRTVYRETRPAALAILGCATGNGLDIVDPRITATCVAVDINPDYLEACRRNFPNRGFALELICGDVLKINLPPGRLALIHAALLLEYVDPGLLFRRIHAWLAPGGICSMVLQRPSETQATVTPSRYR